METNNNKIDCYVDDDYWGAYNIDECEDPNICRYRTGYVIEYSNCLIQCARKI